MSVIKAQGVKVAYGATEVLSDAGFELGAGCRLGVVGPNGAGKTTLLEAVNDAATGSGAFRSGPLGAAIGGSFIFKKGLSVSYLRQGGGYESDMTAFGAVMSAFGDLTGAEARLRDLEAMIAGEGDGEAKEALLDAYQRLRTFFEAKGGYAYESLCRSTLSGLGLGPADWDMPVSLLSGGQRTRVMIGKTLLEEPDLFLLDEPTNHLDMESVRWLEGYLPKYGKAMVIVSHDRYFLDCVATHILEIGGGRSKQYRGNYSSYVAQKAMADHGAKKAYDARRKEVRRLEGIIAQQRRWGRERNVRTAESKRKQIGRLGEAEEPRAAEAAIGFRVNPESPGGRDVLTVEGLSMGYPGKPLFSGLTFDVRRGDRLMVIGRNGCGKSTLLRIMIGALRPDEGRARIGGGVRLSYYDQERVVGDAEETVLSKVTGAYPDMGQTEVRDRLASFLFKGDDVHKRVGSLSGGERCRLTLLLIMMEGPNLLILDEPTNHLDIPSREALEEGLASFGGTVVAVSHDRFFVRRLADAIVSFEDGGVAYFKGGYDEYREHRESMESGLATDFASDARPARLRQAPSAPSAQPAAGASGGGPDGEWAASRRERAERRRNERVLRDSEAEIAALEGRIGAIDAEMASDAVSSDYVALGLLMEEREGCAARLDEALAEWEGASTYLEGAESR
ncbi:MAG: ABC-F family ATP-binding cassette domain-containing protein [Oscillospiraceae bacterium]|nr:ABC-F family ATP-binding cassette domain-containing protein [Oscillospiraceae bacterium]